MVLQFIKIEILFLLFLTKNLLNLYCTGPSTSLLYHPTLSLLMVTVVTEVEYESKRDE